MSSSFVHLKCHTEYSVSDGLVRIPDLIDRCVDMKMPAIALTDRMNLFAWIKLYKRALSKGIKPIAGADLLLVGEENVCAFTAYCLNETGYLNLCELLTLGYTQGQERAGVPTVKWEWVERYQDGLLILSGARFGDIGQALLANNQAEAQRHLQRWHRLFADRFYIELQRTGRPQEEAYIRAVLPLASACHIPVVATNDVRFIAQSDFEAHEARVCICAGYVLEDNKRPKKYSPQQYLRSPEEMQTLFADIPEALANTLEIAKRCTLPMELDKPCLPNFPIPEGMTVEQYLERVSQEGLNRILDRMEVEPAEREAYDERLKIELGVINSMGFPGYFLIVADFIQWAKSQDIPVGPGRGSGAGSLVAYALQITTLDPLQHDLLFERFLNPERVSMPDFDIDFCMERRDEVIDYVAQKYGRPAVSQIITYGTMAAKAVVRDVGRVLGMPYGFVDKIAKLIPFEIGMTLDKALDQEEQLVTRYQEEEEVRTLIDLAKVLEGLVRNAGKHAGGVVIAPGKLTDFCPLYCEPDGLHPVTQFDKDDAEAAGLVKFDFLGLRTLTIIHWAVKAINKRLAKESKERIDIESIPLADEKTFDLLKANETTAVFQLESRGMKDLIRRLQPDCFDDITALVALFRPGPLQSGMVDDFIDRKHGLAKVEYPHPDLEPILKPTYGVILYQEQVMQIAQVLANYSLGGADILRRAMGKKKPEEMAKQRQIFVDGASERGIDKQTSEYIFDLMEKFAGYGFNKSHSAAYALIAYQTAYLKAHFPAEFMAAVLSSDMDNTDKVVGFLNECERMSLTICKPDINSGCYPFIVNEQGQLQYGLGAIKGVGEAAIENIVAERNANGKYTGLFDFCRRVDTHKVNRRAIEPLIRSGAMDDFGKSRACLMASLQKAVKAADQHQRDLQTGQDDLFSMDEESTPVIEDYSEAAKWSQRLRLQAEKETLGYYFSGHPLQIYESDIAKIASISTMDTLQSKIGQVANVAGMITSVRTLLTKRGKKMAVMTIEDRRDRVDVTLFSKVYDEVAPELEKDRVVIVQGKVEADNFTGGIRLNADKVRSFDAVRARMAKRIVISVSSHEDVDELLQGLPEVIDEHKGGRTPLFVSYQSDDAIAQLRLGNSWSVTVDDELMEQLMTHYGEKRICVDY